MASRLPPCALLTRSLTLALQPTASAPRPPLRLPRYRTRAPSLYTELVHGLAPQQHLLCDHHLESKSTSYNEPRNTTCTHTHTKCACWLGDRCEWRLFSPLPALCPSAPVPSPRLPPLLSTIAQPAALYVRAPCAATRLLPAPVAFAPRLGLRRHGVHGASDVRRVGLRDTRHRDAPVLGHVDVELGLHALHLLRAQPSVAEHACEASCGDGQAQARRSG